MGKYHEYYDKLNFGKKDYEDDIRRVFHKFGKLHDDFKSKLLPKALEVGSGTGNHTIQLCKHVKHVYTVDIDPEMNIIASKKLLGFKISSYTDIKDVPEDKFPLCIMMWHVLNYFPNLDIMRDVFTGVYNKLEHGGIFFFDAWNGVAVIRDLPKHVINKIEINDEKIIHELKGSTDLMAQKTTISNHIKIYKDDQIIDQFSHKVDHYIWTAKTVIDMLSSCGFEIIKVAKSNDYDLKANCTDWKIAYIARKS